MNPEDGTLEHFDKLRFDDFWLFTFCTKRIARMFCRLLEPTDEELAKAAIPEATRIEQRPTRVTRREAAVASLLRARFSLDRERAARVAVLVARGLGGGAPPSTRA